jgi:hypothetical protein
MVAGGKFAESERSPREEGQNTHAPCYGPACQVASKKNESHSAIVGILLSGRGQSFRSDQVIETPRTDHTESRAMSPRAQRSRPLHGRQTDQAAGNCSSFSIRVCFLRVLFCVASHRFGRSQAPFTHLCGHGHMPHPDRQTSHRGHHCNLLVLGITCDDALVNNPFVGVESHSTPNGLTKDMA